MMERADMHPDVNVAEAEYGRLLGYPRGHVLAGRAAELAEGTRAWYAEHGRPWTYARQVGIEEAQFGSPRLRQMIEQAEAHAAILVAVSAGPELEERARQLWQEEKPDEYFFLEIFGSAVVEHLTTGAGASLCAWADGEGMAVLPHYSPGYPEWDVAEQAALLGRIRGGERRQLPGLLEVLESGALRPKKSQLAVFGLTRHVDRVRPLAGLSPCENCSFAPCQYRRAPYREWSPANYTVNPRALKRWSRERLALLPNEDGTIEARFRYDGTTCSNLGQALAFDYRVRLGSRLEGYPILEQQCAPAPGDLGHTKMCSYGAELMAAIGEERPLQGQPLDRVLTWRHGACSAGCYCDPAARAHKWGLVLETIHYALGEK